MNVDWQQKITQEHIFTQTAESLRNQRDVVLGSTSWLVERHRDEIESAMATTLSAGQYSDLQAYRQQLRDLPSATGWPYIDIPTPPSWLQQP
ncbi:phage tail assembly chaperone [Aeromonas sp. FDAARGOS 1417]|uniref:phage tail assembly chaperone n=1 Tax=Aeromonas TaxID=642 RepID=UPI001C2196E8|nr:phage tail assembly chaperone [Aeromonas sp. FDAARGOS 1417]QWZ63566.1 phage tail assembly chaperone [Aeromonas sp. FDAARGOS 1417]